jgi:1-aminocyclopropane-1-carboxylate deaminase/D-cysteine desulfhydrase-like pyridoxal-dependent ACC family enzyme
MLQVQTPLERADKLSDALGNDLLLKREDLQPVSSSSSSSSSLSDSLTSS